ncbi:MAG TPA: ankyrin repeat domain-containing protein [Humisphaera sp.]
MDARDRVAKLMALYHRGGLADSTLDAELIGLIGETSVADVLGGVPPDVAERLRRVAASMRPDECFLLRSVCDVYTADEEAQRAATTEYFRHSAGIAALRRDMGLPYTDPVERPRPPKPWHPLLVELVETAVSDPPRARQLVAEHPEALTLRTGIGETALHYLAVENRTDAVRLLIELGAAVNVTNKFGASALAEAIQVGADETIAILRAAGAGG